MKRINISFKIICIYFFTLFLCIIGISFNYSNLYNKVTIIDDKETTMKKINLSIPIKIEFYNDKFGNYILENELSIKNIWNSINEITADSPNKSSYSNKGNSSISIKGTIFYLNGTKDEFEVDNAFKFNNYNYYSNYKIPIIINLKSNLLNYLYLPYNIAKFISYQSKVIFSDPRGNKITLDNTTKESIKNLIEQSTKIEDDKQIVSLMKENPNLIAHIKGYINQQNSDLLKVKSYNVMAIDVYDNDLIVAQYMGDVNGMHIYMKGNLKDTCKKIESDYIK